MDPFGKKGSKDQSYEVWLSRSIMKKIHWTSSFYTFYNSINHTHTDTHRTVLLYNKKGCKIQVTSRTCLGPGIVTLKFEIQVPLLSFPMAWGASISSRVDYSTTLFHPHLSNPRRLSTKRSRRTQFNTSHYDEIVVYWSNQILTIMYCISGGSLWNLTSVS